MTLALPQRGERETRLGSRLDGRCQLKKRAGQKSPCHRFIPSRAPHALPTYFRILLNAHLTPVRFMRFTMLPTSHCKTRVTCRLLKAPLGGLHCEHRNSHVPKSAVENQEALKLNRRNQNACVPSRGSDQVDLEEAELSEKQRVALRRDMLKHTGDLSLIAAGDGSCDRLLCLVSCLRLCSVLVSWS